MAVAEHFVGRTAELGSFDQLLEELDRGHGAALQLVGEPGIGKTRLLAEVAGRAAARGHLVLSGSASELEGDLPFSVFVDALDEYVQALEPRRFDLLADDVQAELATVFPSLSALAAEREVAVQHERYRSHRAVRALLELLASTQPLVLALDDLHWADSASIELLGALLHRPPAGPMLLALAVRPRLMPERLVAWIERAHRAGALTRLELRALTRREAGEFLGPALDGETTDLYEESGGNPFYLEQLARALDRSEGATDAADGLSLGLEVPPTVVAALIEELRLLSGDARPVLEGASVAGDPFDPELAAAAAEVPSAAAIDALDELLRLDLIRNTDVPTRFRFRHPLVRRAVYESTPGGWRIQAHRRTDEELLARGAPASARAHHVERSAPHGDLAAVATLREAGEAAALRAPGSSARWYGSALRLIPDSSPVEERVQLLSARAAALSATGHFAESHATLIESISVAPPETGALRVGLTVACARLEHLLGRHQDARGRLEGALAELPDPALPEAVALMIELAVDEIYRVDREGSRSWAARAVETAAPLGDQVLTAGALAVRAAAAALSGATAEAKASRDDAAELIDGLPDEALARRLDALAHLAIADFYLDQFEAAAGHAERALALGRTIGRGDLFPGIVSTLGSSLCVQGRIAEACEMLDGVVEAARLLDNAHALAWSLVSRSIAAYAAGDLELALAAAEESIQLTKNLDESLVSAAAALALAPPLFETGQEARATELLLTSAGGEELRLSAGGWRARNLELLTRCLLATGKRAEAERVAAAAIACADEVGLPVAIAMADRARAALALDAGDPAEAAERTLAAAAALDEVGNLFEAARTRVLAGRALALAGEADRAAAEFERAAAAFDSFGSHRYRAEAERELRRRGHRIHRRTRPGKSDGIGVESLTQRELEVARLIVDRKTNPEIAAELFLSQKTVETHIRNMFRKLGVGSRVELARTVEDASRASAEL